MKSIYDLTVCAAAAKQFNKPNTKAILQEEKFGESRPTGCSWHKFGNLEVFDSSNGECNVNGFSGCFCEKSKDQGMPETFHSAGYN